MPESVWTSGNDGDQIVYVVGDEFCQMCEFYYSELDIEADGVPIMSANFLIAS